MKQLIVIIFSLLFTVLVPLCYAGDIGLEWDANTEEDLAGYKIYYKTASSGPPYDGTGAAEGDSPIDVGNVTEFTLHNLTEGLTYFIAATAYETALPPLESGYSNEVFVSLILPDALVYCTFEEGDDGWQGATWETRTSYQRDNNIVYSGQYSMRVFATGSPSYLTIHIDPVDWNLDQYPYIQFAYKIPNGVPVGLFFQTTEDWVCLGGTGTHSHGSYASSDTYTLIDDDTWHEITIDARDIRSVFPTVNSLNVFEWFTLGNAQPGHEFWFDEFMILQPGDTTPPGAPSGLNITTIIKIN